MSESLYRFLPPPSEGTQAAELLRALITTDRIRLSDPRRFNDPFDGKMAFARIGAIFGDLRAYVESTIARYYTPQSRTIAEQALELASLNVEDAIDKLHRRVNAGNDQHLDAYRVLCLFKPPDNALPHDLLMWSHYADGHRGICLQFDKDILANRFICKPVEYATEFPSLKELAAADGEALGQLCLFRKAKRWEDEHEWRLLELAKRTENDTVVLPSGGLTGIILGCAVPPALPPLIFQWNNERQQPLLIYQAAKDDNLYGLRIMTMKQPTTASTVTLTRGNSTSG